ncbi:alpha/beta fold hydrolase [Salinicoccus hispanicus]|uniref:Alpha/beta fold hydrolase n=1 Tax=Salinicoccus hispanicus TaxID=157225 RepID=A0A6N8U009_9STAP|nr:alpha/beta fold hydrolase [Salinicoccus hispanicus]
MFLHGYTGGRYELQPLFDYLKSRYEFEYEFPVYPGHGTILDLKSVGGEDWYEEAQSAYVNLKRRVDRVHIIGFSMGGVFASHLAQDEPVEKLLLIAPAFEHIRPSKIDKLHLIPRHFGEHMKMKKYQKVKKRLRDVPLKAYQEFRNIMAAKKEGIESIQAKTLIIHGMQDLLVPYESSVEIAKRIPDASVELIEDAPHLFAFSDHNQLQLNILAERFLFLEKM